MTVEAPAAPATPEPQEAFNLKVVESFGKPPAEPSTVPPAEPGAEPLVKDGVVKPVGQPGEKEEPVPYHRFKEVLTKSEELTKKQEEMARTHEETAKQMSQLSQALEAYKAFGSPEEILQRIAPKAAPADPLAGLTDEEKAEREYALKLLPEYKNVQALEKQIQTLTDSLEKQDRAWKAEAARSEQMTSARRNAQYAESENQVSELAAAAGFDMENPRVKSSIIGSVAEIIRLDKDLSRRYFDEGDQKVVKETTDELLQNLTSGPKRLAAAEIVGDKKGQENLPKAPLKGGVPPKEAPVDVTKLNWPDLNKRVLETF